MSVLGINFLVSDIILVAYQVMDQWARNRSDCKNKQNNGPESCFVKKRGKKSLVFDIYTFCPNMLPVFISEFMRTKWQTCMDNLYSSVSDGKYFTGINLFNLHNSGCCYYFQLSTSVVEPPVFSIIHLVFAWVYDVFVCIHLVLCEDFIVFIIYLICVYYISSKDQLLKEQKHLPPM